MNWNFDLVFFFLFVAEQVVMVELGSYPYSLGLPVARRKLPNNLKIEDVGGFIGRLKIKRDKEGNIFFRYKHFPLTWGPYVFVGQVKKQDPTVLIVRLGPLTCLFFLAFIIHGLLTDLSSTIMALVTVGFFLWYFYFSFLKGYEKIVKRME
jgi:hypothetical protein